MGKNIKIIIIAVAAVLILATSAVLSAIYVPAIRQANHYSDGIGASFFADYPAGDRPVHFIHGPVSSYSIDGKTVSFDEEGKISSAEGVARLYDGEGRFDGFQFEDSGEKVVCTYDKNNLLLSKSEEGVIGTVYEYVYDADGNLLEETVRINEGDSLSVTHRRCFTIMEKDAYKNWTLRRTPDGSLERRIISYYPDPDGEKALCPEIKPLTYSMIRRKNNPATLFSLAERYLAMSRTFEKDAEALREKASPLLEKAVDGGLPEAKFLLGRCLEAGVFGEKDEVRAKVLYEEAGSDGNIPGAILTADRYFEAKDYLHALSFLETAAKGGDALSSLHLAEIYANGWGVEADPAEALLNYRTAASDGNLFAGNRLGLSYEKGRGCEPDSLAAFQAYLNAAMFGQVNAQYNLGDCYRKGIGVSEDRYQARKWYTMAASNGSGIAKDALALLDKEDLELEAAGTENPEEGEGPVIDYKEYFNF